MTKPNDSCWTDSFAAETKTRNFNEDDNPTSRLSGESFPKPKKRSPDQLYVMMQYETPTANVFPFHKYKDFFNWTWTDRHDADIFRPKVYFVEHGATFETFQTEQKWRPFDPDSLDREKVKLIYLKKEVIMCKVGA